MFLTQTKQVYSLWHYRTKQLAKKGKLPQEKIKLMLACSSMRKLQPLLIALERQTNTDVLQQYVNNLLVI